MDIVKAISNFSSVVSGWFSSLITIFSNFFNSVSQVLWYILSIFRALWYALTSILSWLRSLIVEIFNSWVFVNVARAFNNLADYIGGPAVVFISSLLIIIIFRIWVAFVFKLFRLNIDYHSLNSKNKTWNQHSVLDSQKKSLFE